MKSPFTHFIFALLLGVVVSISYGFLYFTISQKSNEVANLQNQIMVESENVSRIASARSALAEIAGDEANVQSYFVSEANVVPFINDLEARGLREKATAAVLSVSKGGSSSESSLLLAVSLKGTFDAIMRTIGVIEYAPYDVSISTLSIEQDAKNSWHADLTLSVGTVSLTTATSTR